MPPAVAGYYAVLAVLLFNEWWMSVSEFGALTREFYVVEIGTWENCEFGGFLGGGRYNKVLLYIKT